ncbi:24014_t:CDS:2 [Entrophospora sp. SA101]|nr:13397_t:CDS:2 [Entrophospora sp. SA101]CAJ0636343.1 12369_t:CDS:2 [Entrophospora sp. SA101]CAJ0747251.1 24014_t:CDS:2 [Entrophospora sp. SA101]CAJ0826822.1 3426_t:CDS:2 [Entrophospora sp. SA101]CAJ0838249.1 14846_t:CDS:2 [Entrophospora sp. SA101]
MNYETDFIYPNHWKFNSINEVSHKVGNIASNNTNNQDVEAFKSSIFLKFVIATYSISLIILVFINYFLSGTHNLPPVNDDDDVNNYIYQPPQGFIY